jgi:hypothetical protein
VFDAVQPCTIALLQSSALRSASLIYVWCVLDLRGTQLLEDVPFPIKKLRKNSASVVAVCRPHHLFSQLIVLPELWWTGKALGHHTVNVQYAATRKLTHSWQRFVSTSNHDAQSDWHAALLDQIAH